MFGVDYRRYKGSGGEDGGVFDLTANTLDFLNPNYTRTYDRSSAFAYPIDYNNRQTGYYIQDHIGLTDAAFLTVGGRVDRVDNTGSRDSAFSPRVGATYLINPHASVYTVWSRSFTPQLGFVQSFDGTRLPNGQGRNIELGTKLADSTGRLSLTAAVFDLTRTNVATDDPQHEFFYLVTGEQKSRGLEIEGGWQVVPGVKLSGAYTNLIAKVTEDEHIPVGTRLGNVPRHNLYVRGDFNVEDGPLRGLGANVSVLWNSFRVADTTYFTDINGDGVNDAGFILPSYTVVDAGLNYNYQGWRLQLDVNNLFNKEYYPDASDPYRVSFGRPRNWRLSLSTRL